MPISRNEEMSNYYATIPIKKRKFPMVRSSSPPPDEQSCLPVKSVKNDLVEDKSFSLVRESSLLSADVGTCSNADKNPGFEIKLEIPTDTNVNLVGFNADIFSGKAKAPISDLLDTVDSQENVLLSQDQKTAGVIKVDLPHNEVPAALVVKMEVVNKLESSCTPELFRTPETVQLLLGSKEPPVPALMVGLSGRDFKQNHDKSYNTSLCLSLNQDKCLDGCKSGDVKSNVASPLVIAARLNWDLNTTMDSWEGPDADGAAPGPVCISGSKKSDDINSTEPVIRSSGVLGAIPDAGQQFHGETGNISVSSLPPSGQNRSEDSLHLGLSTLASPNFRVEHLTSLAKVDSSRVPLNSNMVEVFVSAGNSSSVGYDMVKSEPYVQNVKLDRLGNKCNTLGLPELVDKEPVERCGSKAINSLSVNLDEVVETRSIKSEPVQGIRETEVISCPPVEEVVQLQDNVSSASPSGLLAYPVLLKSGNATSQFEVPICRGQVHLKTNTTQGTSKMVEHVAADMDFSSQGHEKEESKADEDMKSSNGPEYAMGYGPLDSCGAGGDSKSDEKIMNMSADMLGKDLPESDCKADSNNDNVVCMYLSGSHDSIKDNKYEACELTTAKVPTRNREEEKNIVDDYDGNISSAFPQEDGNTAQAPSRSDDYVEDQGETSDDHIKECVDSIYLQEFDQVIDRDGSFQESSTIEESEAIKMAINVTQKRSFDLLGRSDVQMAQSMSQIKDIQFKLTNETVEVDPTLLKPESSITVNDAANASNSGGNRSRIINLPRGSDLTSPCIPRLVTDRSLLSTTRRERYANEVETVFPQKNRVDCYADGPRRFERDRFQTQPYRNYRMDQRRGRGRGFRQRDKWDFDRNFGADFYDGSPDYRVPRHKHASTSGNAQAENNSYHINPIRVSGMGRGGMRPTRDVLPSFCHPTSRTGVGDVTRTRDTQTARRFRGNVFSSKCTDEDGFRNDEKFTRDFPDGLTDPIFSPSRPTYQRFDSRFARGNRNLSNIQRRGLPRIRSKSPVRFESHPSGPWSSPDRGSPDGLNELQVLSQIRSPTTYRMELTRSPGRHFAVEHIDKRCGSPSYAARPSHNFLDVESGRMDQPRSAYPDRRSPSNRIIPRNTRRLDIVDPRERTDNDEFGGPVHSGRFNVRGVDRKGDERRKGGDGCENIRSFCPPFNADGGNLQFNTDEGPRPVRFCTEDGSEFNERGNPRKRDFDRRIKNRAGISQSRIRNLDEEEANYQENKQVWHDDGFDDTSRMKRRY